jgi:succinyl-CoA synthetase beta subunit
MLAGLGEGRLSARSRGQTAGHGGGQPAGDLEALAQAIVALSQLAVAPDPAVLEAEVNPLIVRPRGQGVIAVDALVTLAD